MPDDPKQRSWQAGLRPLRGAAVVFAVMAAIAGTLEAAARTDTVKRVLPPPSYGTRIRFFDLQKAKLDALVKKDGPVDCIFLGSSGALQALDPRVFSDTYAEKTGRRLHCFNFSLPGASIDDARVLAPILKQDYGVRSIVYAFTVRDVSSGALALRMRDVPWIRRRTVGFNVDGFLTDSSAAFRYFAAFHRWLDANREEPFVTFPIREDGFFVSTRRLNASEVVTGWELQMVRQIHGTYDPRTFSELMALAQHGTDVAVVEIPSSRPILESVLGSPALRKETPAYREFRRRLRERAERTGVIFLEAPPVETVPTEGWADLVHMNHDGAAVFSRWTAAHVADAQASKATRHERAETR